MHTNSCRNCNATNIHYMISHNTVRTTDGSWLYINMCVRLEIGLNWILTFTSCWFLKLSPGLHYVPPAAPVCLNKIHSSKSLILKTSFTHNPNFSSNSELAKWTKQILLQWGSWLVRFTVRRREHRCNPTHVAAVCSAAYRLAAFLPSVIDYCSFGNHSCDHECVSVLNGYHCRCNEGYRLLDDGKTCQGK